MKKFKIQLLAFTLLLSSYCTTLHAANISEPVTVPEEQVRAAIDEFTGLSRKEKKGRIKQVKQVLKQQRADKKAGRYSDDHTILLAIVAILLPPLAIWLKEKTLTWKFWVSLALLLPVLFSAWYFWILSIGLALMVVFGVL